MSGGIIRAARAGAYEIVPALTIEDGRLTFRALGILVRLLRLPDGGSLTVDDLSRESEQREGREAVRRALQELEKERYIQTRRAADSRGRWSTQRTVFDTAQPSLDPAKPDGIPAAGKPTSGAPNVGGLGAKSKSTKALHTKAAAEQAAAAKKKMERKIKERKTVAGVTCYPTAGDLEAVAELIVTHGEEKVLAAARESRARGAKALPSQVEAILALGVKESTQLAAAQLAKQRFNLIDARSKIFGDLQNGLITEEEAEARWAKAKKQDV